MTSRSKEAKRMENFVKFFKERVPNNIPNVKFCQFLKDFSKKEKNTIEGSIYHRAIHNYDITELFVFLYKTIFKLDAMSKRCFNRCNYEIKDLILIFFAIHYPKLMKEISKRLHEFKIYSKLTNPTEFTKIWDQNIDDIQKFMRTESIITAANNEIHRDIEVESSEMTEICPSIEFFDSSDNNFTFDDSDSSDDTYSKYYYDNVY